MNKNLPKKQKKTSVESQNLTIVGIGASAGGLEALQEFFKAVPENSGLSFVVIQHLSPDYKSLMDELLARYTKINIKKATDGLAIEPNTIYLIPPRKNMTIFHDKLFLEDQKVNKGLNLPIDIFFRSLAQDKGKNAIGIILSGTGSDGTLGIRAIKETGGMVMVQNNETAKFDGMPRSSISTGLVDYILAPAQMPEELMNYIKHPFVEKSKTLEKEMSDNMDALSKILLIIRNHTGTDFSFYKENTIIRRLERRLSINRYDTLEEYLDLLNKSLKEVMILYRELLIGVTRFFRDSSAYSSIQDNVVKEICDRQSQKHIRVWCVGCSTGEEAYSLGILFLEYLERNHIKKELKIFATDIDKESVDYAGNGFYPDSIVSDVDPKLLSKYFKRRENGYQVNETLRKAVIFATHNVLNDPPFSKIDLISCRNLFIYFKSNIQSRILSMFYFSLNTEGFLFMGSSETVGDLTDAFQVVDSRHKIFSYKKGYKPPITTDLPLPRLTNNEKITRQGNGKSLLTSFKEDFYHDAIYNYFIPPSIIVDEFNNIVRIINDVNAFLKFPKGSFTHDLFQLVPEQLKLVFRNVLRQVKSSKKHVVYENIPNVPGFEDQLINIEGRYIQDTSSDAGYYLLSVIVSKENTLVKIEKRVDLSTNDRQHLLDLEKELQFTKESLQATVEELESSNEELQSSNEELIASNEELQSTNEELQSVNEELYTVNSEYQNKIEELTQLNNDINNLLNNTKIGTLYLDRKLCIRKFTSTVTQIAHIIDLDIGRPVYHLDLSHVYDEFMEDINKVLDSLQAVEKEIVDKNQNWYLLKIMPYRTEDNAVDGIIITFIDINHLKRVEKEAHKLENRLTSALELGKMAWWEWDVTTGNVSFDDKKATMLGYTPKEFPTYIYDITSLIHKDDYERAMQAMRDHLEGKKAIYSVTYRMKTKDGFYKWFHDSGGIVSYTEDKKPARLTGIVIDVTDLKSSEANLDESQKLLQTVLDASPLGKILTDEQGIILYTNQQFSKMINVPENEIVGKSILDTKWEFRDPNGELLNKDEHIFYRIRASRRSVRSVRYQIKTGEDIPKDFILNGSPVFDTLKNFSGIVVSVDYFC